MPRGGKHADPAVYARGDGTYLNTITRNGRTIIYLRISSGPQRDRYVHQLVAEAKLGRPLLPHEEVDHDDGNTLNNDWRNLVVRTKPEHGRKTRRQAAERRQQTRREADVVAAEEAYHEDRYYRRRRGELPPEEPSEEAPF